MHHATSIYNQDAWFQIEFFSRIFFADSCLGERIKITVD